MGDGRLAQVDHPVGPLEFVEQWSGGDAHEALRRLSGEAGAGRAVVFVER